MGGVFRIIQIFYFRNMQIGIKRFALRIQGMILFYSEISKTYQGNCICLLEMGHPEFHGLKNRIF